MAQESTRNDLRLNTIRVARLHFLYVALFVGQIIIYDAWKLITPEVVLRRWIMAAILAVVTTAVWYMARGKAGDSALYKRLIFALILVDITAASFNVYIQRGMAARAVMLYAVPIIVAAVLKSRSAIFTAAVLSVVAYTSTTVAYFVLNFNEGYKIELYGEVGFYSVLMMLLAALLWSVTRPRK
jgi:hypothetical protein